MKLRTWLCLALCLCLTASLAGCGGDETAVYVQSVATLVGMGGIAPGDRFSGMVVSENVTEIKKDSEKTIREVLVKEGDDVDEGQELFAYDTEQLQLTLDKQRLELEQLNATIDNYNQQIKDLERDRDRVGSSEKLQYTIQIQTNQVDLKEAELKVKAKQTEIQQSETLLENATVVSPVKGRVQSINESGTDNYGNPAAYITIQQAGSYRVKGTLGELQRGGIMEGTRIKITSRTDETATWTGTVTLVDYENPSQGSNMDQYYGMATDEMSASSKYPFYVELDSTDGLILGQHVYLEVLTEEDGNGSDFAISSAFLCFEEDGSAYVWAEKKGKLEKRSVTLGEYDEMLDTYEVLDGLTAEDYIAFPDEQLCRTGAPTTHEMPEEELPVEGGEMPMEMPMEGMAEEGMEVPMDAMPEEGMDMPMDALPEEGMEAPLEETTAQTGAAPTEGGVE
ncbi:MAG: efflux RND transporter periplasmic adaptor subunit [Firmicutes bacterium]|nr:efflux RND transporter periplasmic adaptor subunit [Bacillota bacterium]